jgi:hypothetical protein
VALRLWLVHQLCAVFNTLGQSFVALVGFFPTGMFFIVPEMHIFAPAFYRAMTGQ